MAARITVTASGVGSHRPGCGRSGFWAAWGTLAKARQAEKAARAFDRMEDAGDQLPRLKGPVREDKPRPSRLKDFLTETTEEVDRFVYADPDAQSAQGTAG
ncbi:MAG TPA: hypothetical protein VFE89_07450 [Beijerinckiaceae bacterium]|nr:hypothetical protein [Beijerinckiaceae bacterium]